MRDPKRIEVVLAKVSDAWYTYPDMRLGQLITSAASLAGPASPFYMEDDALITGLDKLIGLMTPPGTETLTTKEQSDDHPDT